MASLEDSVRIGIDSRPARQGAKEVEQAYDRVEKKSKQTNRELEKLDRSLDRTGDSARQTASETKQAAAGVEKMGSAAGKASGRVEKLGRATKRAGTAAKASAVPMGRLVSAFAAFTALRRATSAISEFERTMVTFRGVTNSGGEAMQRASDLARELGATTRFSASEAADGLVFLARAGLGVENSLKALPSTLDLAAASGMELGAAADLASNVVTQFGLDAKETVRVVDSLVRVSNQANTNVEQLGEAMKVIGPVAKNLGATVEESAVAVGILGNSGIQASMAGTQLRQVLLTLISPTTEARDQLALMGADMEKLNPATNKLADVFKEFARVQLDIESASSIFESRSISAALTLTKSADALEGNVDLLERMNSAQKLAAEASNTLDGSLRNLRSAVEALFLSAGEGGLAGVLRFTVDLLTDVVRSAAGVEAKLLTSRRAVDSVTGAVKAMGLAWVAMKGLAVASMLAGITQAMWGAVSATQALKFAISATGVGALVVVLGTVIGKFLDWKETIRDTREELEKLRDARRIESITDLDDLRSTAAKAGNIDVQIRAVREQVQILDRYIDEILKKDRKLDPIEMNILIGGVTDPQNARDLVKAHSKTGVVDGPSRVDALRALRNGTLSVAQAQVLFSDSVKKTGLDTLSTAERVAVLTARMDQLKKALSGLESKKSGATLATRGRGSASEVAGFIGPIAPNPYLSPVEQGPVAPPDLSQRVASIDQARKALSDLLDTHKKEVDLLRVESALGREAAEVAAARREAEALVVAAGIDNGEVVVGQIVEEIRLQQQLRGELERSAQERQRNADLAVGAFDTISRGLLEASRSGDSFRDSLRRIAEQLGDLALEALVFDQIRDSLRRSFSGGGGGLASNFPDTFGVTQSATGNVFNYHHGLPEIQRFAMGGIPDIVGREYAFPMSAGRIGTLGENVRPDAKEGIFPLHRGPSGELGVKATGGGGGGQTVVNNKTVNHTWNIQTQDAGSFKKSQRQIQRGVKDGLG